MSAAIHPTAVVEDGAVLGEDVAIGPLSVVHAGAQIGDGTVIGSHCVISHPAGGEWQGKPLVVGPRATIRAHTILYEGSRFGPGLETGHHVMLREGTVAGENLRAGTFVGVEGHCRIGDYTRLHSACIVGQGSTLGDFVWMFPYTVLPNDPLPPSHLEQACTVGSGTVLCLGSSLQPGTTLEDGVYVTANSFAKGHVPCGRVVNGLQGNIIGHVTRLFNAEGRFQHPWMNHFTDAYPDEAQDRLWALKDRIDASYADYLNS